jgi:hypothetical protein
MMSEANRVESADETTVDDVRKIRKEFQKQSGGSLRVHVEQSNCVLEQYRQSLGLKVVQPPRRDKRQDRRQA